jgi:DNA repair photolyase
MKNLKTESKIQKTCLKEKDNVQDWADKTINIYKGCSNNCRYCYARGEAVRFKRVKKEDWTTEILNQEKVKKGWMLSKKNIMFPSTHDITPGTYDACEIVLKKVLEAGNTVLIVSKPRADLIAKLCDALESYKNQILFRFTIGAQDNALLSFWEPTAPVYEDRREALRIAHEKGFNTSVSLEPMLDPANIENLIEDLRDFTTDSMWVGTMNMIGKRVEIDSEKVEEEIGKIEAGQTPEKLMAIYDKFKNDPLIKWKGHVRKILKKLGIEVSEQKDDWRERIGN